jgi:RimJ/RimL family protein N-acetyltransferase
VSDSQPPINIRVLEADDAPAWSELRLEALERELDAFGSSAEDHRKLSLDTIQLRLAHDPQTKFVLGAFTDGKLIGSAGLVREQNIKERHKAWVWGVYVSADWRGKHVGRDLMKDLLDRAPGMTGVEQITLRVATSQAAALRLYRSLGFESFGHEPRALKVADRYIDEEYMILLLPSNADPSSA